MCLLCCGRTLAAYAVDNDIVGMNGAHRPPLSACIQESYTNLQYMQNTQQTVEAVTGANWYLYMPGHLGIIIVDREASVLCRNMWCNLGLVVNMFIDMCLAFRWI